MKKQTQHILLTVLTPILIALGVFTLLSVAIPKAKPLLKQEKVATTAQKNQKEVIHYTAIGDSLTEGIGDLTNSGGFVPIVADDLKEHYNLNGSNRQFWEKWGS